MARRVHAVANINYLHSRGCWIRRDEVAPRNRVHIGILADFCRNCWHPWTAMRVSKPSTHRSNAQQQRQRLGCVVIPGECLCVQ
jgi:hypothetical protein